MAQQPASTAATQAAITANVTERGYGYAGGATDGYIAKQVLKSVEELCEAAQLLSAENLPPRWIILAEMLGDDARDAFDRFGTQPDTYTITDEEHLIAELADAVIPLLVAAETIGIDLLTVALDKSRADVARGVRHENHSD